MRESVKRFTKDEDGAVTVDWVVITALVVGLAGLAIVSIGDATGGVGADVGVYLGDVEPGTIGSP